MIRRLLPLLLLVLLIAPVAAVEEVHFANVYAFQAEDTDSLSINSVRLEGLEMGSNQSYILDSYGDIYQIGVTSAWSNAFKTFNISCTYPNGTTEYQELGSFEPYQKIMGLNYYNFNIQYYFVAYESYVGSYIAANVYLDLIPLSAEFHPHSTAYDAADAILSGDSSSRTILAFSQVTGSSTSEISKVTVYYVTAEEFAAVQENDPLLKFFHGVESLFNWTWDGAVAVVSKIPGVGPYLETFLVIVGFALEEIAFWLNLFFIEYPELTVGMVEFLIIADGIINTRSLWKLLQRIVDDHIILCNFLLNLIVIAIDLITRVISAVANAISSIKPF